MQVLENHQQRFLPRQHLHLGCESFHVL
jgi:hypothetical protein